MELKGKTLFVNPIQDEQGNKTVWIVQNRVYRICQRGEMNVPAAPSPSPSQRGKKTGMCIGRLWDTILPSVMPTKVTTMPSYRITALKQHGHAWHWGPQSDSRITKLSNLWIVLPIEKDDGNKNRYYRHWNQCTWLHGNTSKEGKSRWNSFRCWWPKVSRLCLC